ncbi:MAG: DUF485 domain-containing protein [Candidatus Eremiobacteraeota bacterium]|nr:DUF485 domain-containing protein [Candidatus Eremiobacteraeota bacterium]
MQHHHLSAREWDELAADADFQALLRARRRFTIPAVIFALAFFFALPLGIALAPDYMRQPIAGPLTRAWVFALLQFVMAWVLLALYMHEARAFDERAEKFVERAREEFAE